MGRILRKKPASKKKKATGAEEGQELTAAPKKPAPTPVPKQAPADPKAIKAPAFWTTSMEFLREVRGELKKVTWPSRKQTIGSTVVVIILVAIISIFLGLVDMSLTEIVKRLI